MDSPPEPLGTNQSLTMPKRGDRGGWTVYHPVGCSQDASGDAGDGDDVFQYGFLYDISIDILPTEKSTILEVLGDKACNKTILHRGSQILLIVQVHFQPAVCSAPCTDILQKPDDLIEDLERHLGGMTTEYLHVRVSYRHSSFPERHMQTTGRIQTPPPRIEERTPARPPAPNQKISQETPPPQVPRRKTSLRKVSLSSPTTAQHREANDTAPKHEHELDDQYPHKAARRQAGSRQNPFATITTTPTPILPPATALGKKNSYSLSRAKKAASVSRQASSSPSGPPSSPPAPSFSSSVQNKRGGMPRESRGRWSVAGDDGALVALTPVVAGVKMMGRQRQGETRGQPEKRTAPPVEKVSRASSGGGGGDGYAKMKENRKDRGWSWASWWQ
ncbi:hypothetical protein C8A03DRAFT_43469 [Achaetomium macrosporum]|uniref:Uncharacterized protein n=1 Tax=Achaetomium macrosporum TaxID=79813 RepID=A0AAN7CB83_9PEZI|nr:hypothetical protein C8A03DRAFT_43469 [Achaetomium macrosporum]